jgi:hypothetical protein
MLSGATETRSEAGNPQKCSKAGFILISKNFHSGKEGFFLTQRLMKQN